MAKLELVLVNNSGVAGNLIVAQTGRDGSVASVAWFSRYAYPNTEYRVDWESTDHCFVWSGGGQISPSIVFQASQTVPADLQQRNLVDFLYDAHNRTFNLNDPRPGSPAGTLTIRSDSSIPLGAALIGTGVSGRPLFALSANPNMNYQFQPGAPNRVLFGDIQQGQLLLDVANLPSIEFSFPPNVFSLTVTLNPDRTWTVTPNILSTQKPEEN